ncbi:MoxR family ATPase [Pseudaeromonas paramecii]|uniref:MoxR family ATPase n=1 Tax=Pseudaeromonas paramecii TaxID=2138166 RepID=A0ABP8Q1T8_9GAMM
MPKQAINAVRSYLHQQVLGQPELVEGLMMALLADGHILVEGPPGLAKTRAVKSLARCIEGRFHRIQFTPDLLPADLTGTDIYRPQDGSFVFQPGPLFHHLLLADEINRAPAKVQSALLEAMGEHQITIGRKSYQLPELFLVMATQNPIEQEGTYPLPEAQLDRFMLHLQLDYPDAATELAILRLNHDENRHAQEAEPPRLSQQDLFTARKAVLEVALAPAVENYLVALVMATRRPAAYDAELGRWLAYGASPRATMALARCARVRAWLAGREFVTPDDVQHCVYPVLRHRLLLSMEAEADGIDSNQVIERLLQRVVAA